MTHKTYCIAGHTVAITGPDPDALVEKIKEVLVLPERTENMILDLMQKPDKYYVQENPEQ